MKRCLKLARKCHRRHPRIDGIMMDYVNPDTGGPVMPTMGASMQMLRPGERTKAHRETGSFVYQCAKGEGYSIVNGQSASTGASATSSSCRHGCIMSMPTPRTAMTPACSPSMTCR
jgi:gentisate 1,2-dioxygenase